MSIADTSRLEDVSNSPSPLIVRVDVPMRQLQWLMKPDAECANVGDKRAPDEADASGASVLQAPASAAGYAMLTCTGKDGKPSAATTLVPLDVWLSCPAAEGPESSRSSAPVSETGPGSSSAPFDRCSYRNRFWIESSTFWPGLSFSYGYGSSAGCAGSDMHLVQVRLGLVDEEQTGHHLALGLVARTGN